MIIFKCAILLLILQMPLINSFLTSCLPFQTSCDTVSLKIKTQEEKTSTYNPLYLIGNSGSFELAEPHSFEENESDREDVKVIFSGKKKLIFACPKNVKNTRSRAFSTLYEEDIDLSPEVNVVEKCCSRKVEPMIRSLNKRCHRSKYSNNKDDKKFYLYEIGFKVFVKHLSVIDRIFRSKENQGRTWHPLYTICHNKETYTTLYTVHALYGKSVGVKSSRYNGTFRRTNEIETFEAKNTINIPNSVSLDEIFKKENVVEYFSTYFKQPKTRKYVNASDYLARGHLVPDADMAFIPWKNATYLYANVTPMWQFLNNGVWKSIETNIRIAADKLQKNYIIYTGVYGILSYEEKNVFLDGDTETMPIPIYLWKVLYDKQKNEAIAFVVINDPYEERDLLCSAEENGQDICMKYGWPNSKIKTKEGEKKKIMHCCTVKELRKKVPYAPNLGTKVLRNQDSKT